MSELLELFDEDALLEVAFRRMRARRDRRERVILVYLLAELAELSELELARRLRDG